MLDCLENILNQHWIFRQTFLSSGWKSQVFVGDIPTLSGWEMNWRGIARCAVCEYQCFVFKYSSSPRLLCLHSPVRPSKDRCRFEVTMEFLRKTSLRTDDQAWRDLLTSKRKKYPLWTMRLYLSFRIAGHPLAQNERCLHMFLQETNVDRNYVPGKIRNT